VLLHAPKAIRGALEALWTIDATLQGIVAGANDPMLARIKLAWWRDQLEALDRGPPPAEPRLEAIARELVSRGISGGNIAEIEVGWAALLDQPPDFSNVMSRGATLFELSGQLLGANDPFLSSAGRMFAFMTAERLGYEPPQDLTPPDFTPLIGHSMPRRIRCVTALARLAVRDFRHGAPFETEGTRGRALEVLAHLWSGRVA